MPFKSKAQRRKFAELLMKGEISEETFEEWNRSTGGRELPERVKPAKKSGRKKSATGRKKPSAARKNSATAKRKSASARKKPATSPRKSTRRATRKKTGSKRT